MRHHGGADDADGDVEHFRIGDDLARGHKALQHPGHRRGGSHDLDRKADTNHDQQRDDKGFEETKTLVHQQQQQEGVERRDQRAADQGDAEQKFQRNRGADHFRKVAGDDRGLAGHPEQEVDGSGKAGAAGLREVAVGDDAEPRGERLQQDRHQVRQQDHRQQRVAELGSAREVGGPVARVHITDGDQIAGAEEGQQPARPMPAKGHRDGRIDLRQAELRASGGVSAPAGGSRVGHRDTLNRGLRAQCGRSGVHLNKMADINLYCNSFATASSNHENDTR